MFYPNCNSHRNEYVIKFKKQHQILLLKCLTGHVELNKQLFRLGHIDSSMCPCNEEEESADHFLLRCPIFARQRLQLLGNTSVEEREAHELRISDILRFILDTRRLKDVT